MNKKYRLRTNIRGELSERLDWKLRESLKERLDEKLYVRLWSRLYWGLIRRELFENIHWPIEGAFRDE